MKITISRSPSDAREESDVWTLASEDAKQLLDLLQASAFLYAQVLTQRGEVEDPHLETYLMRSFLRYVETFLRRSVEA